MAILWDDAMATGIAEVDDAHKTLISWINKLNDAMMQRNGKAEVIKILDFLGTYARRHFAHEEQCMHRHRCPAAAANKRAHDEFLVYFTKVRGDVERDGVTSVTVISLHQTLGNWLRNHIMKVDVSLKSCVNRPAA